jgi:hypothetical protein
MGNMPMHHSKNTSLKGCINFIVPEGGRSVPMPLAMVDIAGTLICWYVDARGEALGGLGGNSPGARNGCEKNSCRIMVISAPPAGYSWQPRSALQVVLVLHTLSD